MKKHLVFLCVFYFPFLAKAQFQPQPVNVPSPNAASFQQQAEVPVNLFSGQPNISIPIYEISTSGNSMAITLDFDAKGFKPDVHPGWTGMNWNLSAGGVITRQKKDLFDDAPSNSSGVGGGFYISFESVADPLWSSPDWINNVLNVSQYYDSEPDEFNFNFLGYSGSFYLNEAGQWVVKSDDNLKVEFDGTFLEAPFEDKIPENEYYVNAGHSWMRQFSGFSIIAPDGSKFIFGGTNDAVEYTIPMFHQNESTWSINSWFLRKIIWSNGKEVTFNYERIQDWEQGMFIGSFSESITMRSTFEMDNEAGGETVCRNVEYIVPEEGIYAGDLVSPIYLKSIETQSEIVAFDIAPSQELKYSYTIPYNNFHDCCLGDRNYFLRYLERDRGDPLQYADSEESWKSTLDRMVWYQLNRITVTNKHSNKKTREVKFTYDNPASERLRLWKVQEFGEHGASRAPYIFEYASIAEGYPPYLSRKLDHWGYYNGVAATPTIDGSYSGRRDARSAYLQQGALKKITYPTGGYLALEFENHAYAKSVDEIRSNPLKIHANKIGGGLRIKKLTMSDGSNFAKDVVREFYYVSGYTPTANINTLPSSGILGGFSKYQWADYNLQTSYANIKLHQYVFSTSSILPASNNSAGTHIGYSEVVERQGDGGYVIYRYTNFDSFSIGVPSMFMDELGLNNTQPEQTPYQPYSSHEHKRGKLTDKEFFTSTGTKVKREFTGYQTVLGGAHVRLINAYKEAVNCVGAENIRHGIAYKEYLERDLPSTNVVYDYSTANPALSVELQTQNVFDVHKNIQIQKVVSNDGKIYQTEYKYPYDFTDVVVDYSSCDQYGGPCRTECQATTSDRDELEACYQDCANQYSACRTQAFNAAYYNNVYYQMTQKNQIRNAVEIRRYLIKGSQKLLLSAELYTYKRVTPDKFVVDATYSFQADQPRASDLALTNYTNKLNFDPLYQLTGTVKYNSDCNISEMSKKDDIVISYLWDYENLPVAKCENANADQIAYCGFETLNVGGWIGINPLNKLTSSFLAGTKSYNLSGSTISRALTSTRRYRLSYWSQGGAATITGSVSVVAVGNLNGWTNYVHEIYNVSTVSISGNLTIDELRICPIESFISTYTYEPGRGISSSQDPSGLLKFYEYDEFGILKTVRDEERNIITNYLMHYKN